MNYNYLKIFYVVSKYQNISKAAEILNVTQPAISRVISTLEHEYKTVLFTRSKNGVKLTRDGENLLNKIYNPFAELEKIEKDIKSSGLFQNTTVHIGATAMALECFLFKHLDNLKNRFPDINFRIYTSSSSNLLKKVIDKSVDFAFITTPYPISDEIEVHNVYDLHNILIAPRSYKNLIKGEMSLKQLVNFPFVLLNKEMQFRQHLNMYFNSNRVNVKPVYEPDSSSLLLQFVENDCGLTFIPEEMAGPSLKNGKVIEVEVKEKVPLRHISFVIKKDNSKSQIIDEIKKEILSL